jgi:hypothetical protein
MYTQGRMNASGKVVLYRAPDGEVQLDVRLERETVWLSLDQIAKLLGRDKSVISRHLRNVFATRELNRRSVVAKNATTAADGKTYQVDYFNFDAILSVGYRVNSKRVPSSLHPDTKRPLAQAHAERKTAACWRTLTQHALVTDEAEPLT